MTPMERARTLFQVLTSVIIEREQVAAVIRDAENDALERAAQIASDAGAQTIYHAIRALKHEGEVT